MTAPDSLVTWVTDNPAEAAKMILDMQAEKTKKDEPDKAPDFFALFGMEHVGSVKLKDVNDEAQALLAACNSILNAFALQQIPVPPRLLLDLGVFCRENIGFKLSYQQVATTWVDVGSSGQPFQQCEVVMAKLWEAVDNLIVDMKRVVTNRAQLDGAQTLSQVAAIDLLIERFIAFFGWSRSSVRMQARLDLDHAQASAN